MIFTEARFLWFFLAVFGVFWTLRREGLRKLWLLGASYAFYAAWDWRFLSLIVASTVIDYGCGLALASERRPGRRRAWLVLSPSMNRQWRDRTGLDGRGAGRVARPADGTGSRRLARLGFL